MSAWPSIPKLAVSVNSGETSATQNVEKSLKIIDEKKEFNAIIATIPDRSRQRAKEIDEKVKNGQSAGRLAGVPFIAKDNFLVFGADTTAASNILKGFVAPYQSTVIEKLEAEGAICVAKANLDAFAHGGSTENSDVFITKNPHDKARVPGGSSGGSAAAVVLEMAPFALGTDTGGSTRQPAAYTGCVGYKPSYGLMSRSGIVAMASSTDTVGTLAMTTEEVSLVAEVMAGRDELDSTTIERGENDFTDLNFEIKGKKIGIIKEHMSQGVEGDIRECVLNTAENLRKLGADIQEVSLPSMPLSLATYYIVVPAEISSNLSRYDGQKYGYSDREAATLEESYSNTRDKGFGKEAKRRIMIGTFVLSSGYYDAYYKKAAKVRTQLVKEFEKAFSEFDMLIGPTTPGVAFKIGEISDDPLQMYMEDIMTVGASLAGIPAISIPVAELKNMPVGLQVMAPYKSDRELLGFANSIEKEFKMKKESNF